MPSVRLKRSIVIPVIALLTPLLSTSPAFAAELLRIGGSGTPLGGMRLVGEAYVKQAEGVTVEVLPSIGSNGGIKALSSGAIDIAVTSRPLTDAESRLGLVSTEYSRTPIIIIANEDCDEDSLTPDGLAAILRDDRHQWNSGRMIRLVMRAPHETDVVRIMAISPQLDKAMKVALGRDGLLVAMTDQESVEEVERTPGGLGFSTLAQVLSERRYVRILSFDGVVPTIKSLEEGSYPVYKPSFVVTLATVSPKVRLFLDYLRSSEGRRILETTGNLLSSDFFRSP